MPSPAWSAPDRTPPASPAGRHVRVVRVQAGTAALPGRVREIDIASVLRSTGAGVVSFRLTLSTPNGRRRGVSGSVQGVRWRFGCHGERGAAATNLLLDPSSSSSPAPGTKVVATDGTHFRHTPTTVVVDDGSATGKIVMVGQLYVNAGGAIDGGNGITLLTNTAGGGGAWTRIVAPVSVPDAYDNYCPNYSPALAPTADNAHVVEISTMPTDAGCIARFATGQV